MIGEKKDWGFKWALLQNFVEVMHAHHLRSALSFQPHTKQVVNGYGTRLERAVEPQHIDAVLNGYAQKRISMAMVDHQPLVPRFWHSVVRKAGDDLGWHNDLHDHDPARRYALVIYLNDFWHESWGGETVLRGPTPRGGGPQNAMHMPIQPVPGACLIMEVNKHSFHRVSPVAKGVTRHVIVGWLDDPSIDVDLEKCSVITQKSARRVTPGTSVYNFKAKAKLNGRV